jgi:hypothetical protein
VLTFLLTSVSLHLFLLSFCITEEALLSLLCFSHSTVTSLSQRKTFFILFLILPNLTGIYCKPHGLTRSHRCIFEVSSRLFYGGSLEECGDITQINSLIAFDPLPTDRAFPVLFIGNQFILLIFRTFAVKSCCFISSSFLPYYPFSQPFLHHIDPFHFLLPLLLLLQVSTVNISTN